MDTERSKAIARKLVNASNEGDLSRFRDVVQDVVAEDFVGHVAGAPDFHGRDGYFEAVSAFHSAFSDLRIDLLDLVAEDDRLVLHYLWSGTHRGPFLGIPPTGRSVSVPEVAVARVSDGQLVEEWDFTDNLDLFRQLGIDIEPQVREAGAS